MRIGAKPVLLLVATAIALTVACGGADNVSDNDSASATPDVDRNVVPAPVDALELIVVDGTPPEYSVRIRSGLPSGCAQFNAARLKGRSGATIMIEVTNSMPSDEGVACAAIYGTHEEVVELPFPFKSGKEYLLRANETELRFTAR